MAAILLTGIVAYGVFSLTKKELPKYTFVNVKKGQILQTVSATGIVEAVKKFNLRFMNSGKISEINVKVGDHVKNGFTLARLDISQLESQLAKAEASLSASKANLKKLLEGASREDIKLSETAVENAQIALNNSKQNLEDVKTSTEKEIASAQAVVEESQVALNNANKNLEDVKTSTEKEIASAQAVVEESQVALNNAVQSLNNTKISAENSLRQYYDSAFDTINSTLLIISKSLNENKSTLDYEDAQETLGILNTNYLNASQKSRTEADNSYNDLKNYVDNIESDFTYEEIEEALSMSKTALTKTRDTLIDTSDVLDATITSSKLSQTEIDTLKANTFSARADISAYISKITLSQQNIQNQKTANQTNIDNAQAAINSAESSLNSSKQSLAAVRSSANAKINAAQAKVNSAKSSLNIANQSLLKVQSSSSAKINAAQNAVKTAEGVLKQARDQLALKKAPPKASEISLYNAQIQESQADIDLIKKRINDSILTAPRDGVITEINGDIGEVATSTSDFISIIASDDFEIKANVSEVDIAKVKIGNEVDITFDAFGNDRKFKGTIAKIDPAETEIAGVIYYKVTTMFSGGAETIKHGMTANLDILTAKKDSVIMIPFQALKEKNGKKYVQILENNKVKNIPIEIGLKGDINLEVVDGLKEGQKIITFIEE